MRQYKTLFLALAVAMSFLLGYGAVANAWPGVPDRSEMRGYFYNKYDPHGRNVYDEGIYTNDVNSFINYIRWRLYNGSPQQRVGSAFIIQTMLGNLSRKKPPTQAQMNEWEERVRYAARQGNIRWRQLYSYRINSYFQDDHRDDAFYFESGTQRTIVFRNNSGKIVYALRRFCANPVGNHPGLPKAPPRWTFEGFSTIDGTNRGPKGGGTSYVKGRKTIYSLPGDTVKYFHFLRNRGPDRGATKSKAWTKYPGRPERRAPDTPGGYSNPSPVVGFNPGQRRLMNWNAFRIPSNAQPGQRYCQFVSMYWHATWDRSWHYERDKKSCAEIVHKYNLRPTVSGSDSVAQTGDTVRFNFNVNNNGRTKSRTTYWRVRELVFDPSNPPGSIPMRNNSGCDYYKARGASVCRNTPKGGWRQFGRGNTSLGRQNVTMNYPVGSTVCRILSVAPPTQRNWPRNRWSAPACVTIAKMPTVHFMGGDVSVGNPHQTASASCSLRPNTGSIYTIANDNDNGSVAEYAAFVRGIIEFQQAASHGFGTASKPATNETFVRQLGFANTGSDTGNFGSEDCMTDYYARYSSEISSQASPGSRSFSGDQKVHYSGDLMIDASNIQNGAEILVVVDGDVIITGNITYSGNYGSKSDVPSFALIAQGNIRIRDNVTQLDGIYSSKGKVNTCSNRPGTLTIHKCDQQLVVNGAVLTDELALRRTFGGGRGANESEPAERFNYTTELFFNNVLSGDSGGKVETMEQRDLPPRY